MAQLIRRGVLSPRLINFLTVVALAAFLSASTGAIEGERHQVTVFYADETTALAVNSATYVNLLSALRASSRPIAANIANAIERDAREYPAAINAIVTALTAASKRYRFDLAVFTNELTLGHKFLLIRGGTEAMEIRRFPELPAAPTPPLTTSPLSRPEYFRAALFELGSAYPGTALDVILITDSHGAGELAMTPRVYADATIANMPGFLDEELDRPSLDGKQQVWAAYPGTTKLAYWEVLASVSAAGEMRFPLVFRQSCKSGLRGWKEYFALPNSLGLLADTGDQNIAYDAIDYTAVFDRELHGPALIEHIASTLADRGVHVRGKTSRLIGLIKFTVGQISALFYCTPLAIWLGWFAWQVARSWRQQLSEGTTGS